MNASIIAGTAAVFVFSATATFAQVSDKPFQENWAPSKWGKDDSAGSANHTKNPANVKRAISMIKQNKSVTLGKYYHRDIPAVGTRRWNMVLTGTPNAGPFGENAMVYHDEYVATEIGQISTQFDGPGRVGVEHLEGHVSVQQPYVSSPQRGPAGRAEGIRPNSVENVGKISFICRGIVRIDRLTRDGSYANPESPAIQASSRPTIRRQSSRSKGREPRPGDCVFLHTGHGSIWSNSLYRNDLRGARGARIEFGAGEPGFGVGGCEYPSPRATLR